MFKRRIGIVMKATYTFEILKSTKNGEFYWRVSHKNGKEIARSSETYKRKGAATKGLMNLIAGVDRADYVIEE
jgi:uncharacterized protein YegP (UPF0339 family)